MEADVDALSFSHPPDITPMTAAEIYHKRADVRPKVSHVNLMLDTFIANATPEDLRSIMRNLLATGPPGITPAVTNAARSRLCQTSYKVNPYMLFRKQTLDSPAIPLPHLHDVLTRARSLFGAGMGVKSLSLLASIVRATIGLRWEEEDDVADFLATIDSDITQAIQSCKEEHQAGRITDTTAARAAIKDLRNALDESFADVESWGGEFGFERSLLSLEYWQI